jgi:hypothetical protein
MGKANPNRVTESEVAFAICAIAKATSNGIATLEMCKKEVPNYLKLSGNDLAGSTTRPNEAMWEQQIRNIQSHHATEGNYICEGYLIHVPGVGYQVTDSGKARTHP